MELIIGSHVSFKSSDQLIGSVNEALSYSANTFMFYTGAPQNTMRVPIDKNKTLEALDLMNKNGIDINNVVVHAPYIINLANPNNYDFNVNFLKQEIKRVESIGVTKLVLHPGSPVGLGVDEGIKNIVSALNDSLDEKDNVIVCLETMAGKGSEVGVSFEELKRIIDGVKLKNKIGICMDTCHLNDAGYDISDFDKILDDFDNIIGLNYLKVIHINDSKNPMGSHKDRHENIGFGTIGFDALYKVAINERLKNIPKILETPYVKINEEVKKPPYKEEIQMLRDGKFNKDIFKETYGI